MIKRLSFKSLNLCIKRTPPPRIFLFCRNISNDPFSIADHQTIPSNYKGTHVLPKTIFNSAQIENDLEQYKQSVSRREFDYDYDLNLFPAYRARLKELNTELRALYLLRASYETPNHLKQKQTFNENEPNELYQKLKTVKSDINSVKQSITNLEIQIFKLINDLPNLIDSTVEDKEVVDSYINLPLGLSQFFQNNKSTTTTLLEQENYLKKHYKADGLDHRSIGEKFNIMDFKIALKISGTSWYYLLNDGALLEQALIQYSQKQARLNGFSLVIPPSLVKTEVTNACGFKPRDQNNEKQVYEISGDDLCLTGTAEIPLAGLKNGQILIEKSLPLKYVGISRSYRAEAGARGKDTKGLYRVHEFTKVELFVYSTDTDSNNQLEQLKSFQIALIEKLGIFARVINMPANDLGAPAFKKYDIEAWMPGRGKWGEITSTSNCTDYQSRRFSIKFNSTKTEKGSKFVHTLNGTAMAIPRVIIAIIENNYDSVNNCIWIPEPLREFMDGRDRILPFPN